MNSIVSILNYWPTIYRLNIFRSSAFRPFFQPIKYWNQPYQGYFFLSHHTFRICKAFRHNIVHGPHTRDVYGDSRNIQNGGNICFLGTSSCHYIPARTLHRSSERNGNKKISGSFYANSADIFYPHIIFLFPFNYYLSIIGAILILRNADFGKK